MNVATARKMTNHDQDIAEKLKQWCIWRTELGELLQTRPEAILIENTGEGRGGSGSGRMTPTERMAARIKAHYDSDPQSARIEQVIMFLRPASSQAIILQMFGEAPNKSLNKAAFALGIGRHVAAAALSRAYGWLDARLEKAGT